MPIRKKISKNTLKAIVRLHDEGYQACVVGGAVRDLLLGLQPKDHDVATNAVPRDVKRIFRRKAKIIGRRFQLVHLYLGREIIEVSTFRRTPSLEERKGRKSDSGLIVWRDNEFGTLEEDATRRDFTVNAIYFDPMREDNDGIVDLVGGLDDLRSGIVRTIGPTKVRLAEDPVRMLRACKLEGQYNFRLEKELADEIVLNASHLLLSSRARLLEEFFKILKKPYSNSTFHSLHDHGLLQYLLPFVARHANTIEGQQCLAMLKCRDEALAEGEIVPSRTTALAMMLVPFMESELRSHEDPLLWTNYSGIESVIGPFIREFFSPFKLPKHLVACVRNVLLLIPKIHGGKGMKRLRKHPEFARASDTYKTYLRMRSSLNQNSSPHEARRSDRRHKREQ